MEFHKTPHINAEKEDISDIVLMPGDPLRAKLIAETYLEDYRLVSQVRNMLAFTGYYKDHKITVMGSGMGNASMGIYSYELFKFYDVKSIIRIGSMGAYQNKVKIYDLVLVSEAYSQSTFREVQNGDKNHLIKSDEVLTNLIRETAMINNQKIHMGTIHSSDVFYQENVEYEKLVKEYDCLGVEMESFALFHNASVLNKAAACLLTVSDSLVTKESTSSNDRETKFHEMIILALESAIKL